MGVEKWDGGRESKQDQGSVKNGDTRHNQIDTISSIGERRGLKKQSSWRGESSGMQSIGGEVGW